MSHSPAAFTCPIIVQWVEVVEWILHVIELQRADPNRSRHPLTKYYLSILQWIPLIILTEEVRGAQKDQWPSGSIIHVSMAVAHIVTRGAFGEHALLCVCISPFVGAVLLFLLTYKSIYTIFSQSICPYLKTQTSSLGVNLISHSFLEPFLPT